MTSSVNWARRAGVSVLGVVVLSGAAPALANAAGAHVRNPVAVTLHALRSSAEETSPVPTASPAPSESEAPETEGPETEAPESPDAAEPGEAAEHGRVVSTVAHCAPHGKDPLLAVEGAPANH